MSAKNHCLSYHTRGNKLLKTLKSAGNQKTAEGRVCLTTVPSSFEPTGEARNNTISINFIKVSIQE